MPRPTIFGLTKRFHENRPAVLRPQTKASNAKELLFGVLDSGYKVATAGPAEIGRSETIQYFQRLRSRFLAACGEAAAGIRERQRRRNRGHLRVNRRQHWQLFHSEWKAAERGNRVFEAIFIPWYWHEDANRNDERLSARTPRDSSGLKLDEGIFR
jgi:hypothetical protein